MSHLNEASRPPYYDFPSSECERRFQLYMSSCEPADCYRPGGYHPLNLGDVLIDRYEIIRKLGWGRNSVVWLAFDRITKEYVTLKIMASRIRGVELDRELALYKKLDKAMMDAHSSVPIVKLDAHFTFEGINGVHACLVFKPMGPHLDEYIRLQHAAEEMHPIADIVGYSPRLPTAIAKRVLREVLVALQLLHSHGITHGDLNTKNILFNIKRDTLNACAPFEVAQKEAERILLNRKDGKLDICSPLYLVESESLAEYMSFDLNPLVNLTNFGSAFETDKPHFGAITPEYLRGPERTMGSHLKVHWGVDIWSFGCLMYELLTGAKLFKVKPYDHLQLPQKEVFVDEHLIQMQEVLPGSLPLEVHEFWLRGATYFDGEGERRKPDQAPESSQETFDKSKVSSRDPDNFISTTSSPVGQADPPQYLDLQERFMKEKSADIHEAEAKEILHVLCSALRLHPENRDSAEKLLQES